MRNIHKNTEPKSLVEYRQQKDACYLDFTYKDELRQCLVAEQRGLCCYCMTPIKPEPLGMKIEHWQCRDHHPDRQLDYSNLLGACRGGETRPDKYRHCDSKKGNEELCYCPADPTHNVEARISYLGDGTIKSTDVIFDTQLNEVLNLNVAFLVQNRKAVLEAFQKCLQAGKKLDPAKELPKWDGSMGGELKPYCQVVVYYLKKKLVKGAR